MTDHGEARIPKGALNPGVGLREEGAGTVSELASQDSRWRRAGLVTGCREWLPSDERCPALAEFILWGMMLPPEALGPRCYDHAAKHVGHRALGDPQWAIADLRPLLADLAASESAHERTSGV